MRTALLTIVGSFFLAAPAWAIAVTDTPTPSATPSPTPTFTPCGQGYRVNAGGPQFTDSQGQIWSADQAWGGSGYGYVNGGPGITAMSISGTADETLYQSERNTSFGYRFTVPAGTYQVDLLFAEIGFNCDACRVFDVSMEGSPVFSGVDIHAAVGAFTALVLTHTVAVSDGTLDIDYSDVTDVAQVAAIHVQALNACPPTPGPSPTPPPFAYSNGLGRVVAAPVPAGPDEPVCLYVDAQPASFRWTAYNVAGERVAEGSSDGPRACWEHRDTAPGIYFLRTTVRFADGAESTETLKLALR